MIRTDYIKKDFGEFFKFPVNWGEGIEFVGSCGSEDNIPLIALGPKKLPREVKLITSTFTGGFCFTAVHYYCRLKFSAPGVLRTDTKEEPKYMIYTDYTHPESVRDYTIEMTRLVDKRDLKHDKDVAEMEESFIYGRLKPGDYTHGFWSEKEAIDAGINAFKEYFDKGWILIPEIYNESSTDKIAIGYDGIEYPVVGWKEHVFTNSTMKYPILAETK